jgi:hypothetical protein
MSFKSCAYDYITEVLEYICWDLSIPIDTPYPAIEAAYMQQRNTPISESIDLYVTLGRTLDSMEPAAFQWVSKGEK